MSEGEPNERYKLEIFAHFAQLALDLSSFFGVELGDVYSDFDRLLRGDSKSVLKYGLVVSNKTFDALIGEIELLRREVDGDNKRTANSYWNQSRISRRTFEKHGYAMQSDFLGIN